MDNNGFNMEESQKRLMELLVSRTMKKHGVRKDKVELTEKEKSHLKETIRYLQEQTQLLMEKENHVTEHDVDPATNSYVQKYKDPKKK